MLPVLQLLWLWSNMRVLDMLNCRRFFLKERNSSIGRWKCWSRYIYWLEPVTACSRSRGGGCWWYRARRISGRPNWSRTMRRWFIGAGITITVTMSTCRGGSLYLFGGLSCSFAYWVS